MRKSLLARRTVLAAGAVGAGAAAWSLVDGLASPPSTIGGGGRLEIFPPESGRPVFDRALFPTAFQEAPELAEAVRAGRLPPVAERVGQDPLVIAPLHDVGRYGGTMRRAFAGPTDSAGAIRFATGPDNLLYWDLEWKTVVPNLARAFELSRDGRVLTVSLRRGMRWSDGAPFTADDVLFWYEDMHNDRRVIPRPSPTLMMDGEPVRIERVDDATVQFVSPKPYFMLPEVLASFTDIGGPSMFGKFGLGGFAPKHYLSRFHPRYVEEAALLRSAREAGFANWAIHLKSLNDWALNPELPVVTPWRTVRPVNTDSFELERNPYSIWVDTAGNQLPYIDRIEHVFCSGADSVNFKAGSGGLDTQDRHLNIANLPFLLSNRRRSGYEVYLDPFEGTDLSLRLNLDYQLDPEIGSLLAKREFRRALSMGVDRAAINEILMLGVGHPSSAVPAANNKYYPGPEWAQRWARRDVEAANRLLDQIGLNARDAKGYRSRRDGRGRLLLVCQTYPWFFDYPAVGELVKEQWREIGIDLDVKVVDANLYTQICAAGEVQLAVQYTYTPDPFIDPDFLFPANPSGNQALIGPEFARWFRSSGATGKRPPPELVAMMDLWRQGREATPETRLRIGQEIIRRHVDEVLTIGLISGSPSFYGVRVASRALGNVPRRVVNAEAVRSPTNALPMTFYFRDRTRT